MTPSVRTDAPHGPRPHLLIQPGSVPAVLVTFAAAGFAMGQTLSRLPALRDSIGANQAELGLALMGMGLGSLLAMPFTGRLIDRFGSRAVVPVAILLASTGYAALYLVPSVPLLLLTLTLTGMAVGIWDVGMNIQATHVEQQRTRGWMPYFHAAFSAGAVLGAGAGALAAWQGIGLEQVPVLAMLVAVVALPAGLHFVPEVHAGPELPATELPAGASTASMDQPARSRSVPTVPAKLLHTLGSTPITRLEILIGLVCLAAALAEGAANDWLAILLVDVHDAPEAFGALTLVAFNITMTLGRIIGAPIIDRYGRMVVVRAGGVLAAGGILLLTLVPSLSAALAGGLLWGLGISTIFPAAISAAGEVPGRGNRAITMVSTIAYGAFLFGAPTIGLLAEEVGLDRALFVVVAFLGVMFLLAPAMREHGRRA